MGRVEGELSYGLIESVVFLIAEGVLRGQGGGWRWGSRFFGMVVWLGWGFCLDGGGGTGWGVLEVGW